MQPFQSPAAWRGPQLLNDPNWQHELSADEISQLKSALQAVNAKGLDMQQITAEDFPLGSLTDRLLAARRTLEDGCGSFFLRGWPVGDHGIEDNRRVFWGLSRHLGTPISQSAAGEHLFHVEDAGFGDGHVKARGPNTSKKLSFHCDRCDVIGFLCVRQAKEGGENCLVSSITVHNTLLEQRPDLLEELYQPWYYKTHNVDVSNPDPWCRQPIFAIEQGHFVGYVLRVLIDRAYQLPELPDMTPGQKEALDFLESTCADPTLHYRFRQRPGDFLFVNNFVNFHSRTEFVDHAEAERRRLLLRIWLAMPNSRPLPASFAGAFGATEAGVIRGGIHPAT